MPSTSTSRRVGPRPPLVAAVVSLLLVGGSVPASAGVPVVPPAGVLDQQQTNTATNLCAFATRFEAQTFTAGVTGTLDRVDVYGSALSAGAQLRTVDGSGRPTATVLASAGPVPLGGADTEWHAASFATPPAVAAGTSYAIVLLAACVPGFWYDAGSDAYTGGAPFASADGTTWVPRDASTSTSYTTHGDFAFKTYIRPTTTTTITSDDPDPSVVGQPIVVHARVEPATAGADGEAPLGDILVTRGARSCHITPPSGSCTITPTGPGDQAITAAYTSTANASGTGLFGNSPSAAEPHEVVKASTTTTITGDDPDPSLTGDSVTVTYTVTVDDPGSGTPTGQVTVSDGSSSCTGSVAAGSCSLVLTGPGIHQLTASYAGDPDFRKSDSGAEAHEVDRLPTTTTITGDDPDPSLTGDSVTVTYTVTVDDPGSGTPTGQVTVSDGSSSCTGSVAAGSCSLVLTGAGIHQLTASYAGDPDSRRSDSGAEAHEVTAPPEPPEPPAVVYLQPDLLLRTARPASPFVGGGIVEPWPAVQTVEVDVPAGTRRHLVLRIVNTSDVTDSFRVTGGRSAKGIRVRYLAGIRGTTDITAAVTGGGHVIADLPPGGVAFVRFSARPGDLVAPGTLRTVRVFARSLTPTAMDAVAVVVTVTE